MFVPRAAVGRWFGTWLLLVAVGSWYWCCLSPTQFNSLLSLFFTHLTIFVLCCALCLLHASPLLPFLSLLYNYIPSLLNFPCFACVALKFQTFNQIQPPTTHITLITLTKYFSSTLQTILATHLPLNIHTIFQKERTIWCGEEEKVKKKLSIYMNLCFIWVSMYYYFIKQYKSEVFFF